MDQPTQETTSSFAGVSKRNLSFSTQLNTLQLVIDQTSLGEFKLCPRRYYYRIVCGWVPRTPSYHLEFGTWTHQGREVYEHSKSAGFDHEKALRNTLRYIQEATFNKDTGRAWDSGNRDKNRYTLLQTLTWYLDSFGRDDTAKTIQLNNGKPAIELSFKFVPRHSFDGREFESPITGETIWFAGHIDRLAELNGDAYVCDLKTTGRRLNDTYWAQFNPDNQVSFYTYAGKFGVEIPDKREISGVIIDAAKVSEFGTQFERRVIPRTPQQIAEWLVDVKHWINLMGIYAEMDRWPMNDKACHTGFYGCPYQAVCSRTPPARQTWLENDYTRSVWDPSQSRSED